MNNASMPSKSHSSFSDPNDWPSPSDEARIDITDFQVVTCEVSTNRKEGTNKRQTADKKLVFSTTAGP